MSGPDLSWCERSLFFAWQPKNAHEGRGGEGVAAGETAGFSRGGAREVAVNARGLHGQFETECSRWNPPAATLF